MRNGLENREPHRLLARMNALLVNARERERDPCIYGICCIWDWNISKVFRHAKITVKYALTWSNNSNIVRNSLKTSSMLR